MSFTRLEPTDFVISSDAVTAPAWSNNSVTLIPNGANRLDGDYYSDVYNDTPGAPGSSVQFSISYGHVEGTGSAPLNDLIPLMTPTRINYGQYRNIVYGDNESLFNFGTGNTASLDMVAIQVDRNRYKEALLPGSFNLELSSGTILTDDSKDATSINFLDCGRAYNIISGSYGTKGTGGGPSPSDGNYGLFLPDVGLIILNPAAIAADIPLTWDTTTGPGATNSANNVLMFDEIVSITLNSYETISSNYVFVRIKNADYNYTTNPSYITGSGNLVYSDFINNSQTYITTVGMYNDNNELLAVAKLSKPLVKDFTKEALLRVKLDW